MHAFEKKKPTRALGLLSVARRSMIEIHVYAYMVVDTQMHEHHSHVSIEQQLCAHLHICVVTSPMIHAGGRARSDRGTIPDG